MNVFVVPELKKFRTGSEQPDKIDQNCQTASELLDIILRTDDANFDKIEHPKDIMQVKKFAKAIKTLCCPGK